MLASLGVASAIGFISNLETFSYWIEFISVPIIIIFSGIYVVSETKDEFAQVRSLLKKSFILLSYVVLLYLIYFSVKNFDKYMNWPTAK